MDKRVSHGMYGTRIYGIWAKIKTRCDNVNYHEYRHYGGRGISHCDEWDEFEPFYKWAMNHGYADDLSIDRIDNNGNYEPNNCTWSTPTEQAMNRRSNVLVTYKGETKPLKQWAIDLNLKYMTTYKRYRLGWPIEDIFTRQVKGEA